MTVEQKATELVNWIADKGINGVGPMISAKELADEYRNNPKYKNPEEAIDALIAWESSKNGAQGFATGLGGGVVMAVALPANITMAYAVQARLAATVAELRGFDCQSEQVKTFVLLALLGGKASDVLKGIGIQVSKKVAENLLRKIPGEVLKKINQAVGMRLLTKFGAKGAVNLVRFVPVAGGIVGGAFDYGTTRAVGFAAKEIFPSQNR